MTLVLVETAAMFVGTKTGIDKESKLTEEGAELVAPLIKSSSKLLLVLVGFDLALIGAGIMLLRLAVGADFFSSKSKAFSVNSCCRCCLSLMTFVPDRGAARMGTGNFGFVVKGGGIVDVDIEAVTGLTVVVVNESRIEISFETSDDNATCEI